MAETAEPAATEAPESEIEAEAEPEAASGYPPYAPFSAQSAPASVAETIIAGRDLRTQFKFLPKEPVRPPPRPAKPRGPKATDVKLTKRAFRAHARCLRRHGAVLTDRLESMAKPKRRSIIYTWRDYANVLAPETIGRIRAMLDADEPFKPEQAYEYFVNLRKSRKKKNKKNINQLKKDMMAICDDKRFLWARNATIAFARGIQQRLSKPGRYALADGMLRLSNLILRDICGYMKMKPPSRNNTNPKARFMMEMSDKIVVWIDEILTESDDRMLMMDFDEDEDIVAADAAGDAGFADDFVKMMQDKPQPPPSAKKSKFPPAYLKFTGDMLEAFKILTEGMEKKGDENLIEYGKFRQSYAEGANLLKETPTFDVLEINSGLAQNLNHALSDTVKSTTPKKLEKAMKDMVDLCSNFLAENADINKDKGPAFKALIGALLKKPNELLFEKDTIKEKYSDAATELNEARGLESDHGDPTLSNIIEQNLTKVAADVTTPELQADMKETVPLCSKYLSQNAIDKLERGPAFDLLIKSLKYKGADSFTPQYPELATNFNAAHVLSTAPGLTSIKPNDETKPSFESSLHKVVDLSTPKKMKGDMDAVIKRCANYLSGFQRDREKALKMLLEAMKKKPTKELAKRNNYAMTYGVGAGEAEKTPALIPYLPVKDIAKEMKEKLTEDVKDTPADLQVPMKTVVRDVADVLSQPVAMKSGAAGDKYAMDYLIAVEKSMGTKPLYEYKGYNENYIGGAESLQRNADTENMVENKDLEKDILMELQGTIPPKLTPMITEEINAPVTEASHCLASIGTKKGIALEHLVGVMKGKGEASLVNLQGYSQSYTEGADRIAHSPNLATDKEDKAAYGTVKGKLDALVKEKPPPDNAKDQMEEMVDVSSKYLSAPLDDELSKRRFLCDLMGSKQGEVVAQQGVYKMTYKEAAQEIIDAPADPPKNIDEKLKSDIKVKIDNVVPQKLQTILKDTVTDAASNLADVVKGRGEIVQKIHDGMETEGSKQFLSVGQFNKTYQDSAKMLENAENFSTDHFATVIGEKVTERVTAIPLEGVSAQGKEHVQDGTETVSNYIAGIATKECGLDANALAGWDFSKTAQGPPPPPPLIPTVSSQAMPSRKEKEKPKPVTKAIDVDMDHEQAVQILTSKLKSRGGEIFYKQPRNELTHAQASDWISEAPSEVIKPVKKSADTGRLHKKFERKLSALVASETPSELQDTMQDVIIESSRYLSETFLSKSYKILAREAVISEMQNRCNELFVDIDDGTETFFYAAQRLKKTKSFDTDTPIEKVETYLLEKLNEMIKLSHGTLRKLGPYIKDYIQSTSKYLSQHVTKPDKEIDAYIALLTEMELAGDDPLIEGNISKTNKEAAAYLRKLTTFEDEINKPDQTLKTTIESKLKNLMANVTPAGYEKANMDNVIRQNAGLLASYIKLQQEKTEALKILIEQMDNENEKVLLRHGALRKTYHDGANLLRTKTADQLQVTNPDPVVSRKIQIKLKTLVDKSFATNKYKDLIEDVVEDVMNYLAVYFLEPEIIQVCKCMKNVFIQCELWCEETVRKMSKPCCKCSRHVSVQSLADVCPGRALQLSPSGARVCGEGVEITLTQCPSKHARFGEVSTEPCPAEKPTSGCKSDTTAAFMLYAAHGPFDNIPTKLSATGSSDQMTSEPSFHTPSFAFSYSIEKTCSGHGEMLPGPASSHSFDNKLDTTICTSKVPSFGQTSIIMMAHDNTHPTYYSPNVENDNIRSQLSPRITTPTRNVFSSRTPIATTDQMYDWQSMIVSLSWNVQAWRDWIDDNINKILNIQENKELDETWADFQRATTTEILQWQQYNAFSRQLIIRIATKYKNKKIVSPTRSTVKTRIFIEAHNEMLELIETFNRWTQWLAITIKETDLLLQYRDSTSERWRILKEKVKDHITEWKNYNEDLSESWETRFKLQMSDWLPGWQQPGLVWVVSACGAVPSGAVAAGICDGEAIWVARTTHMSKTLPAALYPSKHCCILYSGGRIHHYTKYQVMCNAMVEWIACRAGNVLERAVSVGNVYVGRVRYRTSYLLGAVAPPRYRCYVVMFGRPVAFDCYELLVMQDDQT